MKLKQKAEEWEQWHGSWLEDSLNEYFDTFSVKQIKRKALDKGINFYKKRYNKNDSKTIEELQEELEAV